MRRSIRRLLDRSFEVPLRTGLRRKLERALAGSSELRALQAENETLRRTIAELAPSGFSPGFADRILIRLAQAPALETAAEILFSVYRVVFNKLALIAGLIIVILILFNLAGGELVPKGEIPYASDLTFARILSTPLL